jgi:EmrB/QacA subfamily drug resistance transporter
MTYMDSRKRNITIAVMVAMFLGAVEGTIVTTAIPTIVRELNGFELISWVFSAYLLTSAISTPIYGKLSDLYGRKHVLCAGIIIFLVGSSLCGLSQSMFQLIGFRALQGLGAGAIFTVTYTIVGDVFTLSERAKVQGALSTVWGVASLLGPFLGGFLIDNLSWHWIFFINIPFGIISIVLLQKNLSEDFERKKARIDYAGIVVLTGAILTLLYGVLFGGNSNNFNSAPILSCFAFSVIFLALFYYIEKRAEEPIMPFEIFTKTNIIINIISFLAAGVLIGVDVYMPIYLQSVLGFKATISGISMAPMSVSWLLSSVIISRAIPKYGSRKVIVVSTFILLISSLLLPTLGIQSPLLLVITYVFIMGFGFGGAFTTLTIVVQESVECNNRGAATATNSLLRTIGQTIAVSVFGTIFNINIVKYFNNLGIKGIKPNDLYSLDNLNTTISPEQATVSLNSGMHVVFITIILISTLCLILSVMIPKEVNGNVLSCDE